MRIGFYLSTAGGSPLQAGMERALPQLGHTVEYSHPKEKYDQLWVFNQCAHTRSYRYPDWPERCDKIVFLDTAEYGYYKRLPGVLERYWNTFADGSLSHDTKNRSEQERLKGFLAGRSFPYLVREFFKTFSFPAAYHPIDYPLYALSVCRVKPNREEYLARALKLFVSWGASHPWRMQITDALRACPVSSEIRMITHGLVDGLPQKFYFDRIRNAACSVSFDGYGSSSFRLTEVLVRTVLVQGPLSIVRAFPMEDGKHCVEFQIESNGERYIDCNVSDKVRWVADNPEAAFQIYEAGYQHCMAHYTEKATAEYILKIMDNHDWTKPTAL